MLPPRPPKLPPPRPPSRPPPRSGRDVCLRTNARGSDRGVRQELAASLKEKPRVRRGLSLGVFQHYNSSVSAWCGPSMTDYEKVAGRVPLSPFLFAPFFAARRVHPRSSFLNGQLCGFVCGSLCANTGHSLSPTARLPSQMLQHT